MTTTTDHTDRITTRTTATSTHIVVLPYPAYDNLHPLLHVIANLVLLSPDLHFTVLLPPSAAQHADLVFHSPAMSHINGRNASNDNIVLRRAPVNRIHLVPVQANPNPDQPPPPYHILTPVSARVEMQRFLTALPQALAPLFDLDSESEGFERRPSSFLLDLALPALLQSINRLVHNEIIPRIPINGYHTASATGLVTVLGEQDDYNTTTTEGDDIAAAYASAHDPAISTVILPTYTELETTDALERLEEELDKPVIPIGFQYPEWMWGTEPMTLEGVLPEDEFLGVQQFLDQSTARYGHGRVVYVDLDRFPAAASAVLPALFDLGPPLFIGYSRPLPGVIVDIVIRMKESPRVYVTALRPGRGSRCVILRQPAVGLLVSECCLASVARAIVCEKPLLAIPTSFSDALSTHLKSSFGIVLDLPVPSAHRPEQLFRAQLSSLWSYVEAWGGGELRTRLTRLREDIVRAKREGKGMRELATRLQA
ncbi:hypothetical protein BCR39DRAFT_555207 [Naematelia encephala]|uniref:Uncharacterized protein n=1 Tax=Naematelia encephala TaxID=71784 RepID=A0A1Y2ADH9_9TREE|nr:hypothetical protein BCR39DRAFT_555207 [Naematelia encephala]